MYQPFYNHSRYCSFRMNASWGWKFAEKCLISKTDLGSYYNNIPLYSAARNATTAAPTGVYRWCTLRWLLFAFCNTKIAIVRYHDGWKVNGVYAVFADINFSPVNLSPIRRVKNDKVSSRDSPNSYIPSTNMKVAIFRLNPIRQLAKSSLWDQTRWLEVDNFE